MQCRELSFTERSKYPYYLAAGISLSVGVYSLIISTWMANVHSRTQLNPNLTCYASSVNCVGLRHYCAWINTSAFDDIQSQYYDRKQDYNENGKKKYAYLSAAAYAFYRPPRDLVHWIVMESTLANDTSWVQVKDFERYRSTYTVSAGIPGSYHDGSLVIKRGGLYKVYSKLTFSCTEADRRTKRMVMELSWRGTLHAQPAIILRDFEESACNIKGDLATMYLEGTFRFGEGDKLRLRFRASDGVTLSSDRNRAYKANIGIYGIGV